MSVRLRNESTKQRRFLQIHTLASTSSPTLHIVTLGVDLLGQLLRVVPDGRLLVPGLEDSVPELVEDQVVLRGGVVPPLLQLVLDDSVLNNTSSSLDP